MGNSPSPMAFFRVIYDNGAIRDEAVLIAGAKGAIAEGKGLISGADGAIEGAKVTIADAAGVIGAGSVAIEDDDFCVDLCEARHPGGEGSHLRGY